MERKIDATRQKQARSAWRWVGVVVIVLLVIVAGLATAATVMLKRAKPILKSRVIKTLESHFDSRVELEDFNVSVTNGLGGLRTRA